MDASKGTSPASRPPGPRETFGRLRGGRFADLYAPRSCDTTAYKSLWRVERTFLEVKSTLKCLSEGEDVTVESSARDNYNRAAGLAGPKRDERRPQPRLVLVRIQAPQLNHYWAPSLFLWAGLDGEALRKLGVLVAAGLAELLLLEVVHLLKIRAPEVGAR